MGCGLASSWPGVAGRAAPASRRAIFRGWLLLLAIGSRFRRPLPAILIAAVSVVTFFLAHRFFDPCILLDLYVFAVAAVPLTWRTGGREAAVALLWQTRRAGIRRTVPAEVGARP